MADAGNPPTKSSRAAAVVAVGICLLALTGSLAWLLWPQSQQSQQSQVATGTPNSSPLAATPANPAAPGNPANPPAQGQPRGRGRNRVQAPPADLVPTPIDPVLIAENLPDDLFHPTGGLTLNQFLDDTTRPSSQPPTSESARLEQARKFVMALCVDHSGNLWVGTEEGGIQRLDAATHQWTQFTTRDGLGDDFCYALACDHEGRIWAGHLNHGVSVFNGQKWRNYEVVAGLSRPDTLSGPLGERVFAIKVCPTDGDVWMATSCGLARYSDSKNTWTYFTRADGLPSDQANAIAFDPTGNIYLATQCDGIAIATASDGYQHWTTTTGPDAEPQVANGDGLPSNLINDVLVAHDGTVYAATDAGLAFSKDKGKNWQFVRGQDWADKVRGLMVNDPAPTQGRGRRNRGNTGPDLSGVGLLAEDYCTCLAETAAGELWVGHLKKDVEAFDADLQRVGNIPAVITGPWVHAMLADGFPMIGTDQNGVEPPLNLTASRAAHSIASTNPPPLPAGAPPLTNNQFEEIAQQVKSLPQDSQVAQFIGDDWRTQGDWVGRYGRQYGLLCAGNWPWDQDLDNGGVPYSIAQTIGPHFSPGDSLRRWMESWTSDDRRVLWDSQVGHRRLCNSDDHGEAYSPTWDGPDLHIHIGVPVGITRISLYVFNYNRLQRDHLIEVRKSDADDSSPPLARCRLESFYGGVYKQFAFTGPGEFDIAIRRNHSFDTICSGIFIDRIQGALTIEDGLATPWFGGVFYDPPALPPELTATDKEPIQQLWSALDASPLTFPDLGQYQRLQAYRAASAANANPVLLANWRWTLRLWTDPDRAGFDEITKQGWETMKALMIKEGSYLAPAPGTE